MATSYLTSYYQPSSEVPQAAPACHEAWTSHVPATTTTQNIPQPEVIRRITYTTYPASSVEYVTGGTYPASAVVTTTAAIPTSPVVREYRVPLSELTAQTPCLGTPQDSSRDAFFSRLAQPKQVEVKQLGLEPEPKAPLHRDAEDRAATVQRLLAPKEEKYNSAPSTTQESYAGSSASDYVPIHRTWAERAETVDRLLAPKGAAAMMAAGIPEAFTAGSDDEQQSEQPPKAPARRLTPAEVEQSLSRLYQPRDRVHCRDIYDQTKALEKEILNFREGNVPKPKGRRPHATSPSGKKLKDPLACPTEPGEDHPAVVMSEQQITETHDRLFQEAKELKRLRTQRQKAADRPIAPAFKLHENEIQEVMARLTAPARPQTFYDEHTPERLVMAPGDMDRLTERLTRVPKKKPEPPPRELRTNFPKFSEEHIERTLERLTRQPKRYEAWAKKEEERRKAAEAGAGAGVSIASGPWMAGIVTSE